MRALMRRWSAPTVFGTMVLLLLPGCGQPVREDRSINWSKSGEAVGFQHGNEGVFVADKQGGNLHKIFQPAADVIATSTPLWSPDGSQVIFTTARLAQPGQTNGAVFIQGQAADGNLHHGVPIVYSCWLKDKAQRSRQAEPRRLFEAHCGHDGYVAANLAVRWHPNGKRIVYIDHVEQHQQGLFEFDLASKSTRRVFPHANEDLIFEWAPDNEHLVCVLGGTIGDPRNNGIWIGKADGADWWHVPHSSDLAQGDLPSLLEQLRATRPVWNKEGTRFAFASTRAGYKTSDSGEPREVPAQHLLHIGTMAKKQLEQVAEDVEPFRQLHWRPTDGLLGVVRGRECGQLHLRLKNGALTGTINERPVRQFAGWNAGGTALAYVVPDDIPFRKHEWWSFLLVPNELARDAVYVAAGSGEEPGRVVFSGMRVTFPQWSPSADKLSLWFTFTPSHQSWISQMLRMGLRPGDPAAVFDLKTQKISWLAVNAHEKAQIGHYYLLKRDYSEAWRWYEAAGRERTKAPPANPNAFLGMLHDFAGPEGAEFFEYYCLSKLGDHDKATAKLDGFCKHFLPAPSAQPPAAQAGGQRAAADNARDPVLRAILSEDGLFAPLLRDLYMAEVFLSLDAAVDGEAFFQEALRSAENRPTRLSHAIVLAQILLVQQKYENYAALATEVIGPQFQDAGGLVPAQTRQVAGDVEPLVDFIGYLVLAPLGAREFVADLGKEQVASLLPQWEKLRQKSPSPAFQATADQVLYAAYARLGKENEKQSVAERIKQMPVGTPFFPIANAKNQETADLRKGIRTFATQLSGF